MANVGEADVVAAELCASMDPGYGDADVRSFQHAHARLRARQPPRRGLLRGTPR
jgi:hypothetical protein